MSRYNRGQRLQAYSAEKRQQAERRRVKRLRSRPTPDPDHEKRRARIAAINARVDAEKRGA